jgi:hypothetical protein
MAETKQLTTRILLLNGTQQEWYGTEENPSPARTKVLKKGEPAIEFIPTFGSDSTTLTSVKVKVGDGSTKYEDLPYVGDEILAEIGTLRDELDGALGSGSNAVFQIDLINLDTVEGESEADKVKTYILVNNTDVTLTEGNIAIVKREIVANNYSYTAYVYHNDAFIAMDGNYNAENVYFDEDLTTTYALGNYTLSNGSATIPAAGKNLKQLWEALYLKEEKAVTINNPSIALTVAGSGTTVEVGSTFTRPTATLKIAGIGSYQYGSKDVAGTEYTSTTATNVTFDSMKVGFGSNIDNATSFTEITDGGYTTNKTVTYTANETDIASNYVAEGTTTFTFSGEAHHTASDRYPVTNLGNYLTAGSKSGTKFTATAVGDKATDESGNVIAKGNITASVADGLEATTNWTITGYREGFYFGTSSTEVLPENITSATIRGLATKSEANYAAGKKTVTIPVGAKTVIIACPSDKTGVTDVLNTTVNANMNESFGVGGTPAKVTVGGKDSTADSVGSFGKEYNVWTFTPPEAYGTAADLTITLG